MAQQGTHHLGDAGAGHQQAHHVGAPMHSAGGGQIQGMAAMEQGDPAHGEPQIVGGGEQQVGPHLQQLDVDLRLVEAVEKGEAIGAGGGQPLGHGGHVGEEGPQLHRQRQLHLSAHLPHDLLHLVFDAGAAAIGISGKRKDVQLDGMGPCGLQLPGKAHPAAGVLAIEAGDHRNRQLAAGLLQVAQVELRAHMEQGSIRHVGE